MTSASDTLVLGLSGFFGTSNQELVPDLPPGLYHDAAACLVGEKGVLAAVEEERVNRRKHTNLFPIGAARFCLQQAGVTLADVDEAAFFFTEANSDMELGRQYLRHRDRPLRWARDLIADRLRDEFATRFDPGRIRFVRHHDGHAASAFFQSGLTEAIVVVMDGEGEEESVSIFKGAADGGMELVRSYPKRSSLGHFYCTATQLLGYGRFDEYKVMGLAPYGDPAGFRSSVGSYARLLPEGRYELDGASFRREFLSRRSWPRRPGEPIDQIHKDLAAAVQEVLEKIVLHILKFWQTELSLPALCLAGGVAQNSSLNGKILSSALFDDLFIHPASHDAGAALGAAMLTKHRSASPRRRRVPSAWALRGVYWGPDLGDSASIMERLARWDGFLDWSRCDDPAAAAAELLKAGMVIGWAQGRSEFGPRALGNRSIVADPRPAQNWRRVNLLVKGRESYRPLAPAVLAEAASDWFEIPATRCPLDYMSCVVRVRPERRSSLGAVTHIDGTARVQLVRQDANEKFWLLISRFAELTGVPVVLNTSFNNSAEPIVQSVDDAIVCFLTTGLEQLIVGDVLVARKPVQSSDYLALVPRLPACAELAEVRAPGPGRPAHVIRLRQPGALPTLISQRAYDVMLRADGRASLGQLLGSAGPTADVVEEMRALWATRIVALGPAG